MLIKDIDRLDGIAQHLVIMFVSKANNVKHGYILESQVDAKHSHMFGRVDPLVLPPSTSSSPVPCRSQDSFLLLAM